VWSHAGQIVGPIFTLATVRASVFISASNTYKAMGGGWVIEADKLTGSAIPATATSPGPPPLF
jgi:multidrug efflux system outer membrane protein